MMAMHIENDFVIAGTERIPCFSFTELVRAHVSNYPMTIELEAKGNDLILSDFDNIKLDRFIRGVCTWGGYAGIATRIINANQIEYIQNRFRDAVKELESNNSNVVEALGSINNINGLGVEGQDIVDKKMSHDIVDNAL